MNIPVKTLKSGFALPVYGLGTWEMGGRGEASTANDEVEIAAIKAAIDRGVTHIDTAEGYGAGHAEELVGAAIKQYDRSKLLIATKVSGGNQAYDGVLRSCEASLKRLGTDYIDLYLLHRFPESGISIADTMRALDRLVDEGLVQHIGVSNFTVNRFQEAQKHTANKLVCNQLEYGLQFREAESRGIIKYCQDNDVLVVAWGPLQRGVLNKAGVQQKGIPDNADVLREMSEKYGKTPYQVALNWLIAQRGVVAISKTVQAAHLEENLGAFGWKLSPEDVESLRREFPDQQTVSARVPLDYTADVPA